MIGILARHSCEQYLLCQRALCYERVSGVKDAHCFKVIWKLLTTMASRNGIHSALFQAERGIFLFSTLSHKICLEKKLLNQNRWSWYHFCSGEVISYSDTCYCINILWEVWRSVFFWATLYNWLWATNLSYQNNISLKSNNRFHFATVGVNGTDFVYYLWRIMGLCNI